MDVAAWLRNLGLERYVPAFRDNEITADILPELTDADLRELGLPLGPRKALLRALFSLRACSGAADEAQAEVAPEPTGRPRHEWRPTGPTQAERRQLTVTFIDLVNSTALSTRFDPEDMRDLLRVFQNTVTGELARVDGHVAKLMGDGVLAYFGWPRAHEDDAERAVKAGLAIVEAVGRLSTPSGEPLAARVGIATGLVVVGELVGEGAAREEMVVGETPNLAARLQGVATPGAVVIADGTRRLLGELFELRELAATQLKGFPTSVNPFQVLGEHRTSSRFESRRSGRAMPMVGRDQELALILERWRQAVAGEGQAVLLVGEAGIGKSRLIQAIIGAVAQTDHIALRYQCSPHHTGTALWPVIQQLGYAAGLERADAEAVRLEKIGALLGRGAQDTTHAVPLVAALLGIDPGERYPPHGLTPHQQRVRTLRLLVEQLLGLARLRPVLMVVEDAHWIDPTTLELLGQAIDQIAGARVLMVLTSRPDNQPSLGGHPHVTRLTLNRLGRGPIGEIITQLVGRTNLPPETLEEIAARTDGVPLFVEELTKAVMEAEAGPRAVVPVSLYASLMARLDRVAEVKEVAQVAACIGREFSYRLLLDVSCSPEADVRAALDKLAAAELVFRRGAPPEASYTFKHALVRDAAHASLLRAQRQTIHTRIVQALEERFPGTVGAEPELLAGHCSEAGLSERCVTYWHRAGQQALVRCAMAEAIKHLTNGLKVLHQLPQGPERLQRELDLQLALGRASIAAKGFAAPETGRAYARARELCQDLGEIPELFPILYGQSVFHFQRGELAEAHRIAGDLLRLGEEHGEGGAQVAGHRMIGSALCQLGRFAESRGAFERALALYDPARDGSSAVIYAIDSRVMSKSWLAHLHLILGDPEQALALSAEIPAFVREVANPNTTAVAFAWGCMFSQLLRERQSAQDQAEEAIAIATDQGFPLYRATGMAVRGWARAANGDVEDGIAEIQQGLADYSATGAEMWSPYFLALLAEAAGWAGQAATGLDMLVSALDRIERIEGRWIEAELHRLRGELLLMLAGSGQGEAEACFHRSLAVSREQGAKMWELRASTSLARLWFDQRRHGEAHALLAQFRDCYTAGSDTPDLRTANALLGAPTVRHQRP